MKYRKGYKYQLAEDVMLQTPIQRPNDIYTQFIDFKKSGLMIIRSGYAWDGPSGPTIDTKSSMRASLVHDAFYQLIRNKLLPIKLRANVDFLFYRLLLKDGMWKWRAKLWHREVSKWAEPAADPKNVKEVYEAP